MANKIESLPKQETVDFSSVKVENFWLPKATSEATQSNHREKISEILTNVNDGFVCIYSELLTDKELIKRIFDLSEKVRFYILVNEYSNELEQLAGKALIRYSGVHNIGSFILVNPIANTLRGVFFGGQLAEASLLIEHFSFKLNKDEIKELFRHFCYHFWESAKTEKLGKEPTNVENKPIDIYYDGDKFDGKDYVYGTLFDFVPVSERGNLINKKYIPLNEEKFLPKQFQTETSKDLGKNEAKELLPKDEFERQKPELKDDGSSIKTTFTWENVPFTLPEGAKKHNIYMQWDNEKEKISTMLNSLLEEITELEKKETTISEKIKLLFLGKKIVLNELKNRIEALQGTDFSNLERVERNQKIEDINTISKEITAHGKEIDSENQKARIDEEIDKIKEEIEHKKSDLEHKKNEISEEERKYENLTDSFCKQYEIESIDKITELLLNLKKENPDNPKIREIEKVQKEISNQKIFLGKMREEQEKIENGIKSDENRIRSKEEEKSKIDRQNEQSQSSLSAFSHKNEKKQTIQSAMKKLEISNLPSLPQIGKLYSANGNHYLAIENWEEYEKGKAEAEQFNAKLCATM